MKSGKIAENILKRSVTNLIGRGPVAGKDCSVFDGGQDKILSAVAVGYFDNPLSVSGAVYRAANNIWAAGGKLLGIEAAFLLDRHMEEKDLKRLTRTVIAACDVCGTYLSGGHTEGMPDIEHAIVTITAIGVSDIAQNVKTIRPGDDIIITKWVGLEETAEILSDATLRTRLLQRFSEDYIEPCDSFFQWLTIKEEAEAARAGEYHVMHDLSTDGIYGALWDISEGSGCGFRVDIKKIPFKQETVEIANELGLDAYRMKSAGSLMIVTDKSEAVLADLKAREIPAVIIGKITDNKDKIIYNEEEIRHLGRK